MPVTDNEIAAAALSALPHASAKRLLALWKDHGSASAAFDAVRSGSTTDPSWNPYAAPNGWPRHAEPDVITNTMNRRGTRVLLPGDGDWPIDVPLDPQCALLFAEGSRFDALQRRAVGIVGTRSASPHGLADAYELAGIATKAGLTVVSGLAIGIDAAAHRGAIDRDGLTIGVVATGLDVTYPRRHVELFSRVRDHGLVLGEYPFGVGPQQWRFPVRNRIIAALSSTCVVVEAKSTGGALSTAKRAVDLGKTVLAMPGSRRNPAAAGTNALLRDGATMLLEPRDLFTAIELATQQRVIAGSDPQWAQPSLFSLSDPAQRILDCLAGDSATVDQLIGLTSMAAPEVAAALRELERFGKIERKYGKFWPR